MGTIFGSLLITSAKEDCENDSELNESEEMELIIEHECRTIKNSVFYQHLKHKIYDICPINYNYGYSHCKIIFKSYSDELYVLTHLLNNERIVYDKSFDNVHKIMDYDKHTLRIGKINSDYKIIERNGISYWSHPQYDQEYLKLLYADPSSLFAFEFGIILLQICTQVLHEHHISISTSIRASKWPFWNQMVNQINKRLCDQFIQQQREHMLPNIFKLYSREAKTFLKDVEDYVNTLNEGRTTNIIDALIIKECFTKNNINYNYFNDEKFTRKKSIQLLYKLLKPYSVKEAVVVKIWYKFAALKTSKFLHRDVKGTFNSCINKCNFETYNDKDIMKLLDYTNNRYEYYNTKKDIDEYLSEINELLPDRPIKLLKMYKQALILTGWDKDDIHEFYKCIAKNKKLDYFKNKYDIGTQKKSDRFCYKWLKSDSCPYNKPPWSKPCWYAHGWDQFQVKFEKIITAVHHASNVDFLCKHKSKEWSEKNEKNDMKICDSYRRKIANIATYKLQGIPKIDPQVKEILWKIFVDENIRWIITEYVGYITPDMYYPPGQRPIINGKKISAIESKGSLLGVSTDSYSISKKGYNIYCEDNVIFIHYKAIIGPPGTSLDPLISGTVMTKTLFTNACDNSINLQQQPSLKTYAEIATSNANIQQQQSVEGCAEIAKPSKGSYRYKYNSERQSLRNMAMECYLADTDISSDDIGHERKKFKNIMNKKKKKKHKKRKQSEIDNLQSEYE